MPLPVSADEGGWNGSKVRIYALMQQNCWRKIAKSNDLNANYNVNLVFKGGDDVYENFGYHRGPVNMAGGNDTLKSAGGLRGGITMGAGSDTLQIEANDSWNGSGIIDDWIALGTSRLGEDTSELTDKNQLPWLVIRLFLSVIRSVLIVINAEPSLVRQVAMGAVGRINNLEVMVITTSLFLEAKVQIILSFKMNQLLIEII